MDISQGSRELTSRNLRWECKMVPRILLSARERLKNPKYRSSKLNFYPKTVLYQCLSSINSPLRISPKSKLISKSISNHKTPTPKHKKLPLTWQFKPTLSHWAAMTKNKSPSASSVINPRKSNLTSCYQFAAWASSESPSALIFFTPIS